MTFDSEKLYFASLVCNRLVFNLSVTFSLLQTYLTVSVTITLRHFEMKDFSSLVEIQKNTDVAQVNFSSPLEATCSFRTHL